MHTLCFKLLTQKRYIQSIEIFLSYYIYSFKNLNYIKKYLRKPRNNIIDGLLISILKDGCCHAPRHKTAFFSTTYFFDLHAMAVSS